MGLQLGIVGLPNVGKSTLFTALTRAKAEAANYPFCTIDPNIGMVKVPDERLDLLEKTFKPKQSVIPAVLEFVDIAGLVKGASKGEGMGNQFLAHIRSVDAILHVVRCFEDPDITHVAGKVHPIHDIEVIDTELMLADLGTVEKRLAASRSKAKGDKNLLATVEALESVAEKLNEGIPVRIQNKDGELTEHIKDLHLMTAKPVLYGCNVGEDEAAKGGNEFVAQVREKAEKEGARVVVISAKMEAELSEMDESERAGFLEELGVKEPGLPQMIRESYALLGLITYFTAGEKEVRAWTIPVGFKAPQAAGVIHTDFEKGFIKAEIYNVEDIRPLGTENAVKEAGKMRIEGKEYLMKDGDICHFRFNV